MMLVLLEKYNNLPVKLRDQMSTPAITGAIKNLELKYKLNLAETVISIMVKELIPDEFIPYFSDKLGLSLAQARELSLDLKHSVFFNVSEYLFGLDEIKPLTQAPTNLPVITVPEAEQLPAIIETSKESENLDTKAVKVMTAAGIALASADLNARLKKLLVTYLKGVRTRLEARDSMMKTVESGGLSLSVLDAERLLSSADSIDKIIKQPVAALRDVEYDYSQLAKPVNTVVNSPVSTPVSTPEPEPVVVQDIKPKPLKVLEALAVQPESVPSPNWRKDLSGKVVMDDIKTRPAVYTPIDELRYMTIKNMRQLNTNIEKSCEIVRQKIKNLEAENFDNKMPALAAWKESPVNQMYVEVCRTALQAGMPFSKALAQKISEDSNFLTPDEFEAIIKLNKSLTVHQ